MIVDTLLCPIIRKANVLFYIFYLHQMLHNIIIIVEAKKRLFNNAFLKTLSEVFGGKYSSIDMHPYTSSDSVRAYNLLY